MCTLPSYLVVLDFLLLQLVLPLLEDHVVQVDLHEVNRK